MKGLSVCLLGLLVLAGCAGQNVKEQAASAPKAAPAAHADSAPAPSQNVAADPLNDPKSILAKRSLYFGFDQYNVKDGDKPMLEAHAKYLGSHAGTNVVLEGNTDERGSSEYNLALGQRRAESARKILTALGASDKQIEAVSYGKEKPKAPCHEESCWAENRRADIVYKKN